MTKFLVCVYHTWGKSVWWLVTVRWVALRVHEVAVVCFMTDMDIKLQYHHISTRSLPTQIISSKGTLLNTCCHAHSPPVSNLTSQYSPLLFTNLADTLPFGFVNGMSFTQGNPDWIDTNNLLQYFVKKQGFSTKTPVPVHPF